MVRTNLGNKKSLKEIEKDLSYEIDTGGVPPQDIVSYNELRSSADLFRMFREGTLEIKPDFQRGIVWNDSAQTRFIDSLMKLLPIPSMCFSLDYKTQQWKVIDGLQRMHTITRFLGENDWKLSTLLDVNQNISGEKVSEIKKNHPELYSLVQNITLPVTVLRCDYSKKNHMEYMFMIFHRLNAGGLKLNNQEIRNAIYSGPFNEFLKQCDNSTVWRKLFKRTDDKEDRFRKVELILRFFAFFDCYTKYRGKLASFLNDYMYDKRYEEEEILTKEIIFNETIALISSGLSAEKSFSNISNVVMEALMFGIAKNIETLKKKNVSIIKKYYKNLIISHPFSEEDIREGIMKKEKVMKRLNMANKIFSGR
jgi:hypothetical protein